MHNIKTLDKHYRRYIKNLNKLTSDSFITVDLAVLHHFNLLQFHEKKIMDFELTRYFQVIETEEKITLINEEFVIWIVPENINGVNMTYAIIALNNEKEPKLELIFVVSGVYNTSRLVLKVLDRFLLEIEENEDLIKLL